MQENFYLELLRNYVKELKKTLENQHNYQESIYNCLLAGIVIRMNSILEKGLLDFHSESFDEVAKLIYDSRQLLVHCSDYRAFSNIDKISKEIVAEFEESYEAEREHFAHVLDYDDSYEHNVVIEKSRKITYDEHSNSYVFKNEEIEIAVSASKVTRIKNIKNNKDIAYIINCESSMNFLFKGEDGEAIYHELSSIEELQAFFKRNFNVTCVDYQIHKECIKDVLENFYRPGNFCASITQQKRTESIKNPVSIETGLLLSRFFDDNIVYEQLLEDRVYTNKGVPQSDYPDYKKLRVLCKKDLEDNISKKDYFFIKRSISMFSTINSELAKAKNLSDSEKEKLKMTLLINWVNHTIMNLNDSFINSNRDFAKLHNHLLFYRNFFAHDILQVKTSTSRKILEEFYEIASGYVSIINSLEIKSITKLEEKKISNFVAIERMPYHFINHKYRQYVEIDPLTYIGDSLIYSTRGSDYHKIIGLVGIDKDSQYRGAYFEKRNGELIAKTIRGKNRQIHRVHVSKVNYSKGQNVSFDVNCDDLLFIYAAYRGKISKKLASSLDNSSHKKVIVFKASEENNFMSHVSNLEDVIANYYQQNYLPFELVKEIKVELAISYNGKAYFKILDLDGNEIAEVIDINQLNHYGLKVDDERYFSLYDTNHDFSKRGI